MTCVHSQGAQSVLDSGLATVTYAVLTHEDAPAALWQGTQLYHDQFQEPTTSSTSLSSHALSYRFLPAWKAVACVSHVCRSENVLGSLFFK